MHPFSRGESYHFLVFEVGLVGLFAAQVLGIVGLRRPGYELLCGIAMLTLALPLLLMGVLLVTSM